MLYLRNEPKIQSKIHWNWKRNLHGTGLRYLSGSRATSRRFNSLRPTPGAPISTIGRFEPGRGYNFDTSSYVAISSRSKSSFSSKLYIIFLVFGPRHVIVFESGDGGGVEQIDAHEPFLIYGGMQFGFSFELMNWVVFTNC